ncbi:MAG: YceI family protein [Ignavibacteriales bacterium]|nr:YceI family protein [Ignavibacteriales bacterium]
MRNYILSALLLIGATVFAADNGETKWKFDVSHSSIQFTVSHMVISEVSGKFPDFTGSVVSKSPDFNGASVNVVIKAGSITTSNEKRDAHLKGADFFDVEKFPEATFNSTGMKKTGEGTYQIAGTLTMHGVSKDVVLDAKFKGSAKSPWGQNVAAFRAATKINREDWGLKWNKALEAGGFLVGQEVELVLTVELVQQV